jgi:hypothetical protein
MFSRKKREIDDWVFVRLGQIPVAAVVPVSLFMAAFVGAGVPTIFHFDRALSDLYALTGAVVGMLPLLAVMHRQNVLNDHRMLLPRNGYAEGIGRLSANEFEHLVAAWYESRNYKVTVTGRSGDGGIDVHATLGVEKVAIQCKHWRTKQVGPREVRELRGLVIDPSIKLVLMTSGTFTEAARGEGKAKGVELVDGTALLERLNEVIADASPRCPTCSGKMRPKDGRHGVFWSCLSYPSCTGSLDFDFRP